MDTRIYDIDYVNAKIYYYEHIDRHRETIRKYRKRRRISDPQFKFMGNMRTRLHIAFKTRKWTKQSKTYELLGCTSEEAISYIESKFTEGMNWENYGKWHIDHIVPLSSAQNIDEVAKLCHFSNLQPLWASDNLKKRWRQN